MFGFDVSSQIKNKFGLCIIHATEDIFTGKNVKFISKTGGTGGSGNKTNMGSSNTTYYCYGQNGTDSLVSSGGGVKEGHFQLLIMLPEDQELLEHHFQVAEVEDHMGQHPAPVMQLQQMEEQQEIITRLQAIPGRVMQLVEIQMEPHYQEI